MFEITYLVGGLRGELVRYYVSIINRVYLKIYKKMGFHLLIMRYIIDESILDKLIFVSY